MNAPEVYEHTTELGKKRVCIRFPAKPCRVMIDVVKGVGQGRYRRSSKGEKACWYVPADVVQGLCHALEAQTSTVDGAEALVHSLRALIGNTPTSREKPRLVDGTACKRRKLSTQPFCEACLYEVRMMKEGSGGFAQHPDGHTCGF